MCAMPLKGLYKDDIPEATLRRIQGNIKRNIPTGTACILRPALLT